MRDVITMVGHHNHAEIQIENLRVPRDNMLGGRGQGHLLGQARLGPARLAHCMRWIGRAEMALDMLVDRALNRFAHGSLLADKQGIQWMIADSAMELYQCKLMVLHAAYKIDRGEDFRSEVSMAKHFVANTLNRVIDPKSKAGLAEWYRGTNLPRLLPLPPEALCSQRFWDHMKYLDEPALAAIEIDLTRRLIEDFKVDVRALFYDTTNFDTFLCSDNPSELARRGHAKSKRTDLRVVGLALMVSWDFHIPLFSRVYEGNQPDSVTFSKVLDDLVARYQMFKERCRRVTLVFDKGNNSEENMEALDGSPYHVIGSLVPSQHQDLLDIPTKRFRALEGPLFEGLRVSRTGEGGLRAEARRTGRASL